MSIPTALFLAVFTISFCAAPAGAGESRSAMRKRAETLASDGHFKDAWDAYERLALDPDATPGEIEGDLPKLMDLIRETGRTEKGEAVLRRLSEERGDSWRVLAAVARSLFEHLPKDGYVLDGEFHRSGGWREGGEYGNVEERDRVEAINLMLRAEKLLDGDADRAGPDDRRKFYGWLAHMVAPPRIRSASWRLTALTALDRLPPPRIGYGGGRGRGASGAPVDKDGDPVFYPVPESWAAAENDGERWRWALAESAGANEAGGEYADWQYASFLRDQFGVQTLDRMLPRQDGDDDANPFSVRTLDENETVARLASGIKRFRLPGDSDYIALFRRLADGGGSRAPQALKALGTIFENRQQYSKAAGIWRTLKEKYNDADAGKRLDRIVGNNGRLEPTPTLPAGVRPKLPFVFRNGDRVKFTAERLDEKRFIEDIKAALKKGGADGNLRSPERIGHEIFEKDGRRYVVETTAEWSVDLEPLPGHYSRRVRVELPFDRAGCYLVTAAMRDGNVTRVVLWVSDLALAAKTAGGNRINYVADAVSGEPVAGATLSFFGYRYNYNRTTAARRPELETREFAEKTDENGLSIIPAGDSDDSNWLTVAESEGRFCFLGFSPVWAMRYDASGPDEARPSAFVITDRPVYRPDQTVRFKAWIGSNSYNQPDASPYAGDEIAVLIDNPMGETIHNKKYRVDEYGGVAGELTLDGSAPLGHYGIRVGDHLGYGGFRLEEYKKPEFEVTVKTPDKALALGDSASVDVEAKYYFGSPVSGGEITYRITRTLHAGAPLPVGRWDWLYGRGYWWTGYDYDWYPGWSGWGTRRPVPPWFPPARFSPPELVAEGGGVLDADGKYAIALDTAVAKALMGDSDHRYEIQVEVADQSRRVIVGSGSVVAARKPFSVTVWPDRGYCQAGDDVAVNFAAMLPEGGGVAGKGEAVLYRISYDRSGKPSEEKADSWDIASGADGSGVVKMRAGAPGQYRVSCAIEDAGGVRVEGAAILTVRGEKGEAGDYRFASLELTPEKREYRPGDVLHLAVGSEKKDAVVLLFPYAGRSGPPESDAGPKVLRLKDGQAIFDMDVGAAEQPNFFVEALTIFNGRIYNETREVFVPPAKQTLKVEVSPDSGEYLPGAPAKFSVRVEDEYGRPVRGQCVVALYDRSVEYVAGGSNVGGIREFFWSWKRYHHPRTQSSLGRWGYRVQRKGDVDWAPLGVFGSLEMDWNETVETDRVPEPPMMAAESDAVMDMAVPAAAPMMAQGVGVGYAAAPRMRAAVPMQAGAAMNESVERKQGAIGGAATGGEMAEPSLRSEFADTALWLVALETDSAGLAKFGLDMPDNLTAWKARVWSKASGTRVGEGTAEVVTRKNVIVRIQTPRFLTQKDRFVLTANVHNYLPRDKSARVELELEGGFLGLDEGENAVRTVEIAAGGEARVDWIVRAVRPGEAVVRIRALTDEESDAAEIKVPVVVHGARRVENHGGVLKDGEDSLSFAVRVPEERLPGESRLRFGFSPTLASAMLEALPFLVEYPYGCTEQTLNRFLPALMTRRYLERLGLSLGDAAGVGEEPDAKSAEWLRRFGDRRGGKKEPVFDDKELAAMVKTGIERLAAMRNADGGWGWFSGTGETSWPHTTAVATYGLLRARENGAAIPSGVVEGGVAWLRDYQDRQVAALKKSLAEKDGESKSKADNADAFVYMILAENGHRDADMRGFLYRDRLDLSLSGMAMFALALHGEGATGEFDTVFGNISQYVERNDRNGTAWLQRPAFGWWWWYNDEIESLAWYLKLLARVDPKGDDAAAVAKYLLQNRRNGTYWRSTRDTAYAIEALADFAAGSGETAPDMAVRVYFDDELVMRRVVKPENLLDDNVFILEGAAVETGEHRVRIEREGAGRLYVAGRLDLFSLEDPMAAAGGDLAVNRAVYKLERDDRADLAASAGGQAIGQTRVEYRRVRIASPFDGETPIDLEPGDLVEVELSIEAANDYEYIVFEDMKAAGLESVELVSGYGNNRLGAYVEYRDRKVTMFVRSLPRGKHNLSYRLRAEVPGRFSALPAFGGGMYATDLFANSDEMKVRIVEKGVFE